MARSGKIASLPHVLREEVNRRLLDGQKSPEILAWLNAHPEAIRIWEDQFEGAPADARNVSNWRIGGYKEWRQRQERVESLKTLGEFSVQLAKAGGNIADGAAAIVGGHILEVLEQGANIAVTGGSDDAERDPNEGLVKMAKAVTSLQLGGIARQKLELDKIRLRQRKEQISLERAKFEAQTCEMVLKAAKSKEIQDILTSGKPRTAQLDLIHAQLFGSGKKPTIQP